MPMLPATTDLMIAWVWLQMIRLNNSLRTIFTIPILFQPTLPIQNQSPGRANCRLTIILLSLSVMLTRKHFYMIMLVISILYLIPAFQIGSQATITHKMVGYLTGLATGTINSQLVLATNFQNCQTISNSPRLPNWKRRLSNFLPNLQLRRKISARSSINIFLRTSVSPPLISASCRMFTIRIIRFLSAPGNPAWSNNIQTA